MNLAQYADARQWGRGLLKTAVHSGTSAILSGFGTNGIEGMTPESLASVTKGIGLTLPQMGAVFVVSAFLGAVKFINESTDESNTPFNPPKP
jgi:hypothetical protein